MLRAKEIEGCGGGTLDLEWLFQAALPWPPKGVHRRCTALPDAAKRAASPHSPSRVCDRKDGAGGVGHGHCKVEA